MFSICQNSLININWKSVFNSINFSKNFAQSSLIRNSVRNIGYCTLQKEIQPHLYSRNCQNSAGQFYCRGMEDFRTMRVDRADKVEAINTESGDKKGVINIISEHCVTDLTSILCCYYC